MVRRELMPTEMERTEDVSGIQEATGTSDPISQLRMILEKSNQEDPDIFWDKLELDITRKFKDTKDSGGLNVGKLNNWTSSTLDYIEASILTSRESNKKYEQIPSVGDKMLPFMYNLMIKLLGKEREIDMDLFNSQISLITTGLDNILDEKALKLKFDKDATQKAFYGDTIAKMKKMPDAKRKNVATRGLFSFGQGMYPYVGTEGIYGSVYMNKYLLNDFAKFNKEVLSDTQNWLEWKEKAMEIGTDERRVLKFLGGSKVAQVFMNMRDAFEKSGQPETRTSRNFGEFVDLILRG